MDSNQHFFTVWTHRSAQSIFGAAFHPVVRKGELLCFATEESAQAECDRLNAGSGGSHVHLHGETGVCAAGTVERLGLAGERSGATLRGLPWGFFTGIESTEAAFRGERLLLAIP